MNLGGSVASSKTPKTRMTLPDINILNRLSIAELMKLRTSVGQGAGRSDPGYKTLLAIIKTKQSQGAKG
jgi:hypothetical protein|tara:strand:+ start:133 stop:339 length:207 start_codon:yes stop_codon:yes gene_type:complete